MTRGRTTFTNSVIITSQPPVTIIETWSRQRRRLHASSNDICTRGQRSEVKGRGVRSPRRRAPAGGSKAPPISEATPPPPPPLQLLLLRHRTSCRLLDAEQMTDQTTQGRTNARHACADPRGGAPGARPPFSLEGIFLTLIIFAQGSK